MPDEFDGCPVLKTGMRPDLVVMPAPVLDDDARLGAGSEPFQVDISIPFTSHDALPTKLRIGPLHENY